MLWFSLLKKGRHKTKSERKRKVTVGVQALAALAALVYLTAVTRIHMHSVVILLGALWLTACTDRPTRAGTSVVSAGGHRKKWKTGSNGSIDKLKKFLSQHAMITHALDNASWDRPGACLNKTGLLTDAGTTVFSDRSHSKKWKNLPALRLLRQLKWPLSETQQIPHYKHELLFTVIRYHKHQQQGQSLVVRHSSIERGHSLWFPTPSDKQSRAPSII